MSVKAPKANAKSRSRTKLIAKISAYIALLSGVAGLVATGRKYIHEHNYVPLQQYYATLKGDCLNSFVRTGMIDAPGGSQVTPEYVTTLGFGSAVRTSITEISSANKPRTIDEATFLVLKNVSAEEAKEIRLFGKDQIGALTHVTSGSTVAICVRYASTTGQNETLEVNAYEFAPERGSAKRAVIDPYDEKKVRQASAAKSCEILGYPPTKP